MTPEERERQIATCTSRQYVFAIVRQMGFYLGINSDTDDLVSAGVEGALRAARTWDGERPFGPYANLRIKGAVIDQLRVFDHLGRHSRRLVRRTLLAYDELRIELGREPTDDELIERTGLSRRHLADAKRLIPSAEKPMHLGGLFGDGDEIDAEDPLDVEAAVLLNLDYERLGELIEELPPRQREVILSRTRGESIQVLANEWGVTQSRVSQILSAAREKLYGQLMAS